MATITGYTAERMKAIEDSTIVDGDIVGDNLVLETRDGTTIDAGNVRGPQGIQGPVGEVSTAQLNAAINASHGPGSTTSTMLADSSVITSKIASGAVTDVKIGTAAVTNAKIAANAVDATKIATGAVGSTQLGTDSVTAVKIAAGAVGNSELGSNAVTADKIAAQAVGSTQLGAGAVSTFAIAGASVTPDKLAASVLSEAFVSFGDTGSNWSGESGYYKRLGNIVFFHFQGTLAAVGFTTFYNVPVGFRPGGTLYFGGFNISTATVAPFNVSAGGNVASNNTFVGANVGHVYTFDAWWPV